MKEDLEKNKDLNLEGQNPIDKNNEKLKENEDFISFELINSVLIEQNKNKSIPGFRQGKVPLELLKIHNPDIVDNLIEFYFSMKTYSMAQKNQEVKIEDIKEEKDGFRILYTFTNIEKKETNNNLQNDQKNTNDQDKINNQSQNTHNQQNKDNDFDAEKIKKDF